MRRPTLLSIALAILLSALFAATAHAESAPKPKASEKADIAKMKKEADALMDQDRYVDALALYARAYEASSDPALLYNQGRALEAMGEYPEALDKLERFEKDAPPSLKAKVPGLHDLIVDLRGRIATLLVTTNAPSARLLVREKAAGTVLKETRVRTRAGPATVEIVADGYYPYKKEIELVAGSTTKIDAQLLLKKSDALVIVRSRPNADITVDGKAIGRSPLELHLPPGQHTVVAQAEGRERQSVPMTLALGDRREVDIELKQPPGITSRWWFWTGIGVIVAGGAATALAFTIEKDPTPGTFGTGRTTGP